MGTGYTRNDTANNIADGNIINASDLDGEFDAVQSAFNASTGHTHDGTAGEGAPIETIGPSQDVVATASVLRPKTDNTVDLGTASLEYKDLFLDGTAHIDTLDVDENASITGTLGVTGTTTLGTANITTGTITTADINGGNIDGTIIGATTAAAITGTTITGTSFVTSGDMTFGDNDKAIFGAGSDLQIYHSGSGSYVKEGGTGSLYIQGTDVRIQNATGENILNGTSNGAVTLYYDNAPKIATTSTGISVTGNATFADNGKAIFGAGSDLQIYHTGSYSLIADTSGTGPLRVVTNTFQLNNAADTENMINAAEGGAVTLYNAGAAKLATTSTGIDVTGTVTADGFQADTSNTNYNLLARNSSNVAAYIQNGGSGPVLEARSGNMSAGQGDLHLKVDNNGDISFYEDTGTTAKLFWDASAESLGIGTTSPSRQLHLASSVPSIRLEDTDVSGLYAEVVQLATGDLSFRADHGNVQASSSISFSVDTTEAMRITSSGNVGIGTTSPVFNTGSGIEIERAGEATLRLQDTTNTANGEVRSGNAGLTFYAGAYGTSGAPFIWNAGGTERLRIDSSGNVLIKTASHTPTDTELVVSSEYSASGTTDAGITLSSRQGGNWRNSGIFANGDALTFTTGDTGVNGAISTSEKMRIDSSGNVGIGESSPQGRLHLKKTDTGNSPQNPAGNQLVIENGDSSGSADIQFLSASNGYSHIFFGDAADANVGVLLYDHTNNSMQFQVNTSEAMRITSGGDVYVGTASLPIMGSTGIEGVSIGNSGSAEIRILKTSSDPNVWIKKQGATGTAISFYKDTAAVGTIVINSSSVSYNTTSDHRLKENVVELTGATARLNQLAPKRFNFIADANTTVDGFIAHEVQSVVPEAITGTHNEVDADGNPVYQGIDQSKLVPLLVATIKELEARITVLENA